MSPHTEKLTFVRFRGGSQPVTFEFQPNKKFVLIFGENGTGKSTIVDAIDFVCNNEFGSLRDRSGTTPRTHVVTLNGQPKDLAVTLQYAARFGRPGCREASRSLSLLIRRGPSFCAAPTSRA